MRDTLIGLTDLHPWTGTQYGVNVKGDKLT
eukprot:COSAG01_NODE_2596_length_7401_cov_12.151055_5_plen_30_part_00